MLSGAAPSRRARHRRRLSNSGGSRIPALCFRGGLRGDSAYDTRGALQEQRSPFPGISLASALRATGCLRGNGTLRSSGISPYTALRYRGKLSSPGAYECLCWRSYSSGNSVCTALIIPGELGGFSLYDALLFWRSYSSRIKRRTMADRPSSVIFAHSSMSGFMTMFART